MKIKYLAAAALAASIAAAPANAAVTFTGTTQGCFGASCTPVSGTTADPNILFLDYVSGGFSQMADGTGFLGIGGTNDNLGTFNLTGLPNGYTGDVFKLLVNFTAPGVANSLVQAVLQGTVTNSGTGSVYINFDNTPQLITAANGQQFTFAVNDVSIAPGVAQILSGQLQAVPEPATWAMMLLGFGAMGFTMRRRSSSALPQLA